VVESRAGVRPGVEALQSAFTSGRRRRMNSPAEKGEAR
jgi:hypothetical protein